ncbi:MAG TPA: hypothetical protein VM577_18945 [Anaerovoracaceae bacterium]|nr:hypothetical protein [Anaerovoracaceae bacterium]
MKVRSKQDAILYLNYQLTADKYLALVPGSGRSYSSIQEWQDSEWTSFFIDDLISKFGIQSDELNWNPEPMPEWWCYLCDGHHRK